MKKRSVIVFLALMFVGILFVLSFIGYSDGDDAFFYQYANQMGLAEYLSWRYETWVGRMAAEALVWFTFRRGIWFWRVVNAVFLLCLPIGILRLAERTAESGWYAGEDTKQTARTRFGALLLCFTGYLWMNVMTLGYAAVWVNGSIFYTWSFSCGIFALFPVMDAIHGTVVNDTAMNCNAKNGTAREKRPWYAYWYALPCSVVAAMSIEQMGAVLLTLLVLSCAALLWRRKTIPVLIAVQTAVTALSFAVLFLAPGNELRVAQETISWMPQYDSLSVGEHLFLTVQWLLSSFANENCIVMCVLWLFAVFVLWEKNKRARCVPAILFIAAGLAKYAGISLFSDMGMSAAKGGGQVLMLPRISELSAGNIFALLWWSAALIYTLFLMIWAARTPVTLALVYLAGIASEAVMYFSPTMYASGPRVYYLTDLLYIFLIAVLFLQLREKKNRRAAFGLALIFGAIHFGIQVPVLLELFQNTK